MGGATLAIDGVRVEYPVRDDVLLALASISLTVGRGQFVSLIGPSGCGKSTLLRVVAGLRTPTQGTVVINGQPITRPFPGMGIVFQEPVLLDWRTVLANVMLQAEVRWLDRPTYELRAQDLLEKVGLAEFAQHRPYQLSGGMRQRVSICRALLHDPSLLLMDEPLGALDALTREHMAEDLQRLWMDMEMTVLFVTHSIPEAVLLSDRVIVLSPRPGRVLADVSIELPRPRQFRNVQSLPEYSRHVTEVRALLDEAGTRPGT